jgi:N6-adenosine-specific RNA methylase IME4
MFEGLPYRHFKMIVADPPWAYQTRSKKGHGRSAEKHYGTMSLSDMARLPVEAYAAPDCHLLLWITGPFLAIGAHIHLMQAWGFMPVSLWGVWIKPTKGSWEHGHLMLDDAVWKMGLGHTTRQNAEFVIAGRRGQPERASKAVRQIMTEPLRQHSRKPEIFYKNAELYAPGPRLELFGRERRKMWEVRGNEADKFPSAG